MGFQNSPRCQGMSRQEHRPCHLPPIPFGDFCRFHGGNTKFQREKAEKRMREYMLNSTDPVFMKNVRYQQWKESDRRYQMRRARKRGPEYVAALEREWAAEKAEKLAWAAEKNRARAERAKQWRRDHPRYPNQQQPQQPPTPDPDDPYDRPIYRDLPIYGAGFDFSDL